MQFLINIYSAYTAFDFYNNVYKNPTSVHNLSPFDPPPEGQYLSPKQQYDLDLHQNLRPLIEIHKIENLFVNSVMLAGPGGSNGVKCLPHLRKSVLINIDVCKADMSAAIFIAKHELAHIIFNHQRNHLCVTVISTLAISILFHALGLSSLPGLLLSSVTLLFINCIHKRAQETQADQFAFDNSSAIEIRGAIREFRASQMLHNECGEKCSLLKYLPEFLNAPIHPPLEDRLSKAKKTYREKASAEYVETTSDLEMIKKLKK